MSKRTELAKLLGRHCGTSAAGDDHLWAMADIVLELIHPAIETTEELEALPVGSIVLDAFAATYTKVREGVMGWRRVTSAVASGAGHWHPPYLPATVLIDRDEP